MAKPLRLTRTLTLDITPAAFYQAASGTDRVNRLTGLPAVRFTPGLTPDGRQALRAEARMMGLSIHWYDLPFEWVENQYWIARRLMEGVPLKQVDITTTIQPLPGDRTQVRVVVDVLPSNILGRLGASLVFGTYALTRIARLYRQFAAAYQRQAPDLFPPTTMKPVIDRPALARLVRELRALPLRSEAVNRLLDYFVTAPDDAVSTMRPFVLADRWGLDRMEVLRVFLYATRIGLLDMRWDVLCPNCRVAKVQAGTLGELEREAHCDTCNIRYDVNFDEAVELRFTPNQAVRETYEATYCIGGPFQTPHIVAQLDVAPGETRAVDLADFAPGHYRWRTRQRAERGRVEIVEAGPLDPVVIRLDQAGGDAPVVLAPGASLRLDNPGPTPLLVMLEHDGWGNDRVSAALVTALQEFRTLFSSQVLAPGLNVGVRNLTVLFSDLKDSTTLYERVGDSPAYASVRDHFAIMTTAIGAHRGAVVKTIGDAVMAVFYTPADAVAAGLAIQAGIAAYNAQSDHEPLTVKLGLHRGPCIAINANDVLDYFGTTVNIAARVQGTSEGDDLILSEAVYSDPAAAAELSDYGVEPFTARLKGLSQEFTLYRVRAGV
jgi:class 3 adenylate cyclase